MATTATKAEVPTFSYAQAAKGLAASTTSQQNAKATDQSGKTTQDNEVTKASAPEQTPNSVSAESSRLSEKAESVADHESKSATTASTKNPVSGASTPSFETASTSTLAKEDEIPTLTNGDSHWENKSQTSASADKSNNSKDKDGKKDDSAKSADKNPPVKELKAAPLPTINVWQQRKEAQEAKAKASAAILKAANAANKATPSKGASPATANAPDSTKAANKKKTANDSQADASGSLNKDRKRVENGKPREEGPKKSTNRLPRSNEESADVAPPPVADATAWPTPQTALGEEKRKAQEKSDKSEKVEKSPSTRGKEKWTPVHYVPTAVFNTPLPSGARRGGRPSRGGREGGRGGAHSSNSNTDSSAAPVDTKPAAAAQPSQAQPKQHANLPERGRNEGGLARANSLPAQARKPVTTDANAQQPDQRRFQPNSERPRVDTRPKATEENHAASNGSAPVDSAAKTSREPRSAKAPEFIPAHKASDRSPRSGTSPVDGQGNGRFVPNHERRFDNGTKSVETPRDINGFVPREREFKDYNREKGEYQRDHQKERGESRPERGRGTYRGRGSHPYNGPHNQHFQNSQVSQHPFVPKSFNAGDRQRSQHQNFQNGTQPQHVNHRLSLRSPSVPNSAGLYSAYPVPDINTMYQGYQHVAPGPMSAVPYQPYMEPFNLFTLIQMQLEYYFSVDNLCKDLYLRKHMDSQGFVRLSFIAGFKRIRNLTEDFEMLRHCARQLRNAEYMISEDGQDRLRPREKWEQWVLPIDQRDSSAQNDGHTAATFHSAEDNNSPVHMTNGINSNGSQAATNGVPNGVHEQVDPQTTLSSAAPEFTPYVAVGGHNESSNGTAQ